MKITTTKTLTKEKLFAKLFMKNMFSNDTRTDNIAIATGYAKKSAHQACKYNI